MAFDISTERTAEFNGLSTKNLAVWTPKSSGSFSPVSVSNICVGSTRRWFLFFTIALPTFSQENSEIQFDPREVDSLFNFTWSDYLIGTGIALAGCWCWWWLVKLLERNRSRVNWRVVRYVWPTTAVAVGVLIKIAGQWLPDFALGCALVLLLAFNPPAFLGMALGAALSPFDMSDWRAALVVPPFGWICSYAAARFLEWRAWRDIPIALGLK